MNEIAIGNSDIVARRISPVRWLVGLAAITFTGSNAGLAQTSTARLITGSVRDSAGTAIAWANVNSQRGARVLADSAGMFSMSTTRTEWVMLDVRRIGYAPAHLRLPPGGDTSIVVTLQAAARTLAGVTVQAEASVRTLELHGFYRRLQDREKGINAGYFITAEDIERRKPNRITQMIEGLPSVREIRLSGLGADCLGDHDARCRTLTGVGACAVNVYLNGRRLNPLNPRNMDARRPYVVGLEELVPPTSVAGIEVYTSAVKAPPEYQSLAGLCAVVLLWTK